MTNAQEKLEEPTIAQTVSTVETPQIKASEILLEILNKLRNIEKYQKLQDFQQKILIQRINEQNEQNKHIFKLLSDAQISNAAPQKPEVQSTGPSTVQATELPPIAASKPEPQNLEFDFKIRAADVSSKGVDTAPVSDETNTSIVKTPVTQVVVSNNKGLVHATVVIKNSNGDIVKETQTNKTGRWQAMLPHGTYMVMVKGKSDIGSIEYDQSFEVPTTTSPVLIPMPEIYKRTNI